MVQLHMRVGAHELLQQSLPMVHGPPIASQQMCVGVHVLLQQSLFPVQELPAVKHEPQLPMFLSQ
jgi:hypothetical protein